MRSETIWILEKRVDPWYYEHQESTRDISSIMELKLDMKKFDFLEIYKTISVMILEIRKLQISTDYIHQIFSENVLEMFCRTITIN